MTEICFNCGNKFDTNLISKPDNSHIQIIVKEKKVWICEFCKNKGVEPNISLVEKILSSRVK